MKKIVHHYTTTASTLTPEHYESLMKDGEADQILQVLMCCTCTVEQGNSLQYRAQMLRARAA